jgi:hypothetical protein
LVGNSSSDDVFITQATGGAGGEIHGTTEIQLSTGKAVTMAAISASGAISITVVTTAITTASTAVYLDANGASLDAGSIDVYGIR